MVDIAWPRDLAPYRVSFYLQPHVGGQESPITRTRKTYGLSAPRWVARLTFRGGYDGAPRPREAAGFGPRLDSLVTDLAGGLNIAVFHDWRRPLPVQGLSVRAALTVAEMALAGASSMKVAGFSPRAVAVSAGDYIGGDQRPHIVSLAATQAAGGIVSGTGSVMVGADGVATIGFNPPLSADVPAGTVMQWPVTGRFQLVAEDAGENETEVGGPTEYALDFVEDLL
ncbi:hypothetical protein [uncultured Sphingomonas sp.]|uniref:hypothetical protein n=1 Tax=uncultured Sphingomonas sp. TaxID=158754 RepID=UPI0026326F32|nr:hypothetical protein [uncultured Sphingomonas sp.]